jgi:hypothetical protein
MDSPACSPPGRPVVRLPLRGWQWRQLLQPDRVWSGG